MLLEKIGGKKYGEGVYGITYDFACKLNDNETFCKMLKEKSIKSIQLHSFQKMIELNKKSEIIRFIKYIHNLDCCVAKVYKGYMIGFDERGFHDELKNMKTIYEIFGNRTEKETTLTSLKLYGFNFLAAFIVFNDDSHIYTSFTTKCSSDLYHTEINETMYKTLIENALHIFTIIQRKNFAHADIKPDNIMYCSKLKKFKIIDWGISGFLNPGVKFGATIFTAPLVKYLMGFPAVIAPRLMYYSAWHNKTEWFQSAIFQELYKIIIQEFDELISINTKILHEKYKYKFDLFNFGMTLAYIVFANKLNWKKHRNFIIKLISFKNGYLNAEEVRQH